MYSSSQGRMLTAAFEKVMTKFYEEDVKLVIRLNDELYDRSHFVQTGMDHGEEDEHRARKLTVSRPLL